MKHCFLYHDNDTGKPVVVLDPEIRFFASRDLIWKVDYPPEGTTERIRFDEQHLAQVATEDVDTQRVWCRDTGQPVAEAVAHLYVQMAQVTKD